MFSFLCSNTKILSCFFLFFTLIIIVTFQSNTFVIYADNKNVLQLALVETDYMQERKPAVPQNYIIGYGV